jgi:hypothetical protein
MSTSQYVTAVYSSNKIQPVKWSRVSIQLTQPNSLKNYEISSSKVISEDQTEGNKPTWIT